MTTHQKRLTPSEEIDKLVKEHGDNDGRLHGKYAVKALDLIGEILHERQ